MHIYYSQKIDDFLCDMPHHQGPTELHKRGVKAIKPRQSLGWRKPTHEEISLFPCSPHRRQCKTSVQEQVEKSHQRKQKSKARKLKYMRE